MKIQKLLFVFFLTVTLFTAGLYSTSQAQGQDGSSGLYLRSVGLQVGSYSPSFDYFDRTFWDFSGGAIFGGEVEVNLFSNIGLRAGVGYFNTTSDVTRGQLGQQETLEYRLIPIGLGLVSNFDLDVVTLSVSPGVDFNMVNATYISAAGEQESSGSTTTFNVGAGIEKAFGNIAIELYGNYNLGSFDQDIQFGAGQTASTEEIALDGLNVGLKLKYLF